MAAEDQATVAILDAVGAGVRIDEAEAAHLFRHAGLLDLAAAATAVRNRHNDPARVSYVIDRNVNYTDVCNVYCTFCAFYHKPGDSRGYVLTRDQLRRRPKRPRPWAARASSLQGGVNPDLPWSYYLELVVLPARSGHLGARLLAGGDPDDGQVQRPGPGGDHARTAGRRPGQHPRAAGPRSWWSGCASSIAPLKGGPGKWLEVMDAAHAVGMKTTGTMMFGITETLAERVEHYRVLRSRTGPWHGPTAAGTPPSRPGRSRAGTPSGQARCRGPRTWSTCAPSPWPGSTWTTSRTSRASWVTMGRKTGQMALDAGSTTWEPDAGGERGERRRHLLLGEPGGDATDNERAGYQPWQRDNIYRPV